MGGSAKYEVKFSELADVSESASYAPLSRWWAAEQLAIAIGSASLGPREASALLFRSSSIVLNCAFTLKDPAPIDRGKSIAELALSGTTADEPLYHQSRYNVANPIIGLCDLGHPEGWLDATRSDWEPKLVNNRIENRILSKDARQLFFDVRRTTPTRRRDQ